MIIAPSSFPGSPLGQFNGHLQTLVPGIRRRVPGVHYQRERIATPDDDFLDLDWIQKGHRRLVVLTHGLEGDSERQYVRGMARYFGQHGWDVLAWNCRSCSGEMNLAFRMYHHGDTEDIQTVVSHALENKSYDELALIGFSMGGNITMKYLGVLGEKAPPQIRAAVAFSSPCDIAAGADVLDRWDNTLYRVRFLRALSRKIQVKNERFPGKINLEKLKDVRRWRDFDEWFSAPLCGFGSASEFHEQASAKNFVAGIRVPTLLISALNDPILTPACFPVDIAREHPFFHLEMPAAGGHCGFQARGDDQVAWSERRALEFVESVIKGNDK